MTASTPVLVTGWNAVYRVVGVRQAHCWVLRQPAMRKQGRVFLDRVRVTRFVSYPLTLTGFLTGWVVGCGVTGLPGGFVRCLRTA